MYYNTTIKTTYQNLMEDEKSDTLYRKELLNVFGLKDFELSIINDRIAEVYNNIEHTDEFKNVMQSVAGKLLSTDEELGFMLCFSFHSFHILHQFLVKYFDEGVFDETLLNKLNS